MSLHHLRVLVKCDLNHNDQAVLALGAVKQRAVARTAAENAADTPEADASKADAQLLCFF